MTPRIPFRIGIPIILMALPVALLPLIGTGPIGRVVFWCAVVGHMVGADWLLAMREPRSLSGGRRAIVQIAIGAPSGLWTVILMTLIVRQGDVAWMGLPFAIGPALCVWPFVIGALLAGPNERSP